MNKPLLVVVGYVWPEPNSSAAGSRMLGLLREFLQRGWQIVFASAAALSPHRFDLSTLDIEEKIIQLNDSSFDDWIKQKQPQAVMFDRFFTEEQFGWRVAAACPNAVRLLDTEDLHSLRAARHNLLKAQAQEPLKPQESLKLHEPLEPSLELAYTEMAQLEMAQREVAAIFRCDLTIMISRQEIKLLRDFYQVPEALLAYVPLGVSSVSTISNSITYEERQHIVMIGNFRHEPNWDSVVYLKQHLWPLIRKKFKQVGVADCELHIYGAYPPPKATQLHQPKDKFFIKGWAENALDVMGSARLCLAPIRFGAGQKGKLLDAMLVSTPSVTTPIGAEAMVDQESDWPGVIAKTSDELSDAVVNLYIQKPLWLEAASKAHSLVKQEFLLSNYYPPLFAVLNQLQENISAHRLKNPIGRILQSQQFKSTEYMGQWIEAKTKLKLLIDSQPL